MTVRTPLRRNNSARRATPKRVSVHELAFPAGDNVRTDFMLVGQRMVGRPRSAKCRRSYRPDPARAVWTFLGGERLATPRLRRRPARRRFHVCDARRRDRRSWKRARRPHGWPRSQGLLTSAAPGKPKRTQETPSLWWAEPRESWFAVSLSSTRRSRSGRAGRIMSPWPAG